MTPSTPTFAGLKPGFFVGLRAFADNPGAGCSGVRGMGRAACMAFAVACGCGAGSACAERWGDWRLRRSKLNRADEKRPSRGAMPRKAARPRVSRRRESRSGIGRRGGGNGRVGRACKFDPLSFAEGPTHDLGVVFSCPDRTFAKIGSERWQPKNSERTALI